MPTSSTPSPDLSVTDTSSITALLTVVAAVLTSVFHRDLSAYVPIATIAAAGIVTAVVLASKHHYAAALAAAAGTVASAGPAADASGSSELARLAAEVESAFADFSRIAAAVAPIAGELAAVAPPAAHNVAEEVAAVAGDVAAAAPPGEDVTPPA